jgi:hypothetical protein
VDEEELEDELEVLFFEGKDGSGEALPLEWLPSEPPEECFKWAF